MVPGFAGETGVMPETKPWAVFLAISGTDLSTPPIIPGKLKNRWEFMILRMPSSRRE